MADHQGETPEYLKEWDHQTTREVPTGRFSTAGFRVSNTTMIRRRWKDTAFFVTDITKEVSGLEAVVVSQNIAQKQGKLF